MNIFKKLFSKGKKEEQKQEECWYNNHHEKEKGTSGEPLEGVGLCGENSYLYATAQQAAKKQ